MENAQEFIVTGGLRYDFIESRAASCMHFQSQNGRFRDFETGYWKDFQKRLYECICLKTNPFLVIHEKNKQRSLELENHRTTSHTQKSQIVEKNHQTSISFMTKILLCLYLYSISP
jgi:hypothetical protein